MAIFYVRAFVAAFFIFWKPEDGALFALIASFRKFVALFIEIEVTRRHLRVCDFHAKQAQRQRILVQQQSVSPQTQWANRRHLVPHQMRQRSLWGEDPRPLFEKTHVRVRQREVVFFDLAGDQVAMHPGYVDRDVFVVLEHGDGQRRTQPLAEKALCF